MIRLIIKNLWARRRKNGWLLAELILVSIVTWVIVDPLVVLTHDRNLPEGYRPDHLFLLQLASFPAESEQFHVEENDTLARKANFERLLDKLKHYEGVKYTTFILNGQYPSSNSTSNGNTMFDTIPVRTLRLTFMPHTDYFRTMGMEGAEGMTTEQLDNRDFRWTESVLTADVAYRLKDGKPLYGRRLGENGDDEDYRVGGVIAPLRYRSYMQPMPIELCVFEEFPDYMYYYLPLIAFRIDDNLSDKAFLHHFREWMDKGLTVGNYYVKSVRPFSSIQDQHEFSEGITNQYRLNLALGIFFLVNLCLGVAGTFWMQTRSRREEVGIMLSFGGNPSHITRLLLYEGWVLTTLGTLIGCLLYLQYALKDGLYTTCIGSEEAMPVYWINHFGLHFAAVSLIVYLLLLIVVSIGIWMPAHKLSRINPVDALRDE